VARGAVGDGAWMVKMKGAFSTVTALDFSDGLLLPEAVTPGLPEKLMHDLGPASSGGASSHAESAPSSRGSQVAPPSYELLYHASTFFARNHRHS
jgi:hypothetical protein